MIDAFDEFLQRGSRGINRLPIFLYLPARLAWAGVGVVFGLVAIVWWAIGDHD